MTPKTCTRLLSAALALALLALGGAAGAPATAQAATGCTITDPMAGIYVQAGTLYRNVAVAFSASGTPTKVSGTCPTGTRSGTKIIRYEWDLDGNGSVDRTTTSPSASYTYGSITAAQKAQVRVVDDLNRTSAFNFTLFALKNKPPTAALSVPATGIKGQSISFSGAGSSDVSGDPSPHIKKYHWLIDGNTVSAGATASYTFSTTGTKTIQLRVEDAESGFSDWVTKTITIGNPPPVITALSVSNATPQTGQSVSFSAAVSAPAGGLTYRWDFGDGSGATSSSTSKTWSTPGTRTVTLTVRDANGETDTEARSITVQSRPPVAAFACTPQSPFAGEQVTCTSSSTDPDDGIASQWWDVNLDGSADAYGPSVSFTSQAVGTVGVRLTVTDGSSVSRHLDKSVVFAERKLLATFAFAPAAPLAGQAVTFDGTGSRDPGGPITKYEWDLDGNGTYETSTGTNPKATRTYAAAGDVTVRLRVSSSAGTATTSRVVPVMAVPAAGGGGAAPAPAPAAPRPPVVAPKSVVVAPRSTTAAAASGKATSRTTTTARKTIKAGACASLKGKRKSACVKRQCTGLKGAKKAACAKKVSRKAARRARR